ncbi:MAG: ATP-binding protein [Panacagrimonas sp.]
MTPARPRHWVAVGALVGGVWIVIVGAGLYLILHQPWLGLRLLPAPGDLIVVTSVRGPSSDRVPVGAIVNAVRRPADAEWLVLTATDLVPTPSYLQTYAELNRFFQRQGRIREVLGAPTVELRTGSGAIVSLTPARRRPLISVPGHVGLMFAVAALVLLVAGVALARARSAPGAWVLLLASIGMVMSAATYAVYSARELALSAESFRVLIGLNHWCGIALASTGGALVPWLLPRPLSPVWGGWAIAAIGLTLATVGEFRLASSITLGLRVPMTSMFACAVLLGVLQWRRSGDLPVDRAMLRWWTVPALSALSLYFVLLVLPGSAGAGPYVSQSWGYVITALFFIGLGLGAARFKLFYVNPVNLLVWGATGAICAGTMVLLDTLVDRWLASCLGLAAAGLLYFPARDLIWRLQPHRHARMETALQSIAARAVGTTSPAGVTDAWRASLRDIFRPMTIEPLRSASKDVELVDEATMDVSLRASDAGLRLLRPYDGRSLYSPRDLALARMVGTLFSALSDYWDLHARGQRDEREEIAELLRDRMGARIRALRNRVDAPSLVDLLDAADQRLTAVLEALTMTSCGLSVATATWQRDFAAACDAAGIRADICVEPVADDPTLGELHRVAASRFVQESAANIVRHSGATEASLTIRCADGCLHLVVEDDGRARPQDLQHGRGLKGLASRSRALGGRLELRSSARGGLSVHQMLPLDGAARELADAHPSPAPQADARPPLPHSGDSAFARPA